MSRFKTYFWLLSGLLFVAPAQASDCLYFRTAFHLMHCTASTAKDTMPDYSAPDLDVPDIGKGADKPFIKLTCSCDYSLSGSDLRCDFDRNEDQVSVIPVDEVKAACRRGQDLCDSLCTRQIHR